MPDAPDTQEKEPHATPADGVVTSIRLLAQWLEDSEDKIFTRLGHDIIERIDASV